jgi:hypothetical protein
MVTVDSATTGYLNYVLPPSIQGDITIRVTDSNRDGSNRSLDTLWIDHMYIRSQSPGPGSAPAAPDNAVATGTGMDMIEVTWNDNSGDKADFEIQRREAGSSTWSLAGSAPAGTTGFMDEALSAATTYDYRVRAYAAGGTSSWSATVSGTTLAAAPIDLQASGYKVKGVQHADLSWTDIGTTSYEVYRDDLLTNTTTEATYTDNLGIKGGGSYSYRVCETGTMVCSNTVEVTF